MTHNICKSWGHDLQKKKENILRFVGNIVRLYKKRGFEIGTIITDP